MKLLANISYVTRNTTPVDPHSEMIFLPLENKVPFMIDFSHRTCLWNLRKSLYVIKKLKSTCTNHSWKSNVFPLHWMWVFVFSTRWPQKNHMKKRHNETPTTQNLPPKIARCNPIPNIIVPPTNVHQGTDCYVKYSRQIWSDTNVSHRFRLPWEDYYSFFLYQI